MSLQKYNRKRNFKKTPEPSGKLKKSSKSLTFVIHKHDARRLHYDLRLELDGVLKSWAVPKGPSLNPVDKRLAVMVEDHPLEYGKFHGVIPEGNYGAGTVEIWDKGTYSWINSEKNDDIEMRNGLKKGSLKLSFKGKKIKGDYALVQSKSNSKNWLLIKKHDSYASKAGSLPLKLSREAEHLIKSGQKKPIPDSVTPMFSTLVEKPFNKENWIFELKWDGYRCLSVIKKDDVNLFSRKGNLYNQQYAPIYYELKKFNNEAIFDGEIIAADENGKSDFQSLQNYNKTGEGNLLYYIFDVLYFNGYDLTKLPLIERKKILKEVAPKSEFIRVSDYYEKLGKNFYEAALGQGMEGILAKKKNSIYRPGERVKEWQKIKTSKRQEAVIVGMTEPKRGRKWFGSLILGAYVDDNLQYIGHSGGGFKERELKEYRDKLNPYITSKSPLKKIPKLDKKVTWVEPEFVCEVKFSEWTSEGLMRHPVFMGFRGDKDPHDVTKELPNIHTGIPHEEKMEISNPEKIFWPKEQYTKKDLINYYNEIGEVLLPYLKDRAESLKRYPNGINEEYFFQKNVLEHPAFIKTHEIFSEDENKITNYIICNDKRSLLHLINLGCIDLNPWNSKIQSLDYPDYLIIDLDPVEIGFDKVIKTAQTVHKVLDRLNIESYCKTSGMTGMHIYLPVQAKYETGQIITFAEILCQVIHNEIPEFTSMERLPAKRKNKVYLDYLQNRKGATVAAAYSVRPANGAPVSTPLEWSEVTQKLESTKFNILNTRKRLDKKGDLWKGVLGKGIDMQNALEKLTRKYSLTH